MIQSGDTVLLFIEPKQTPAKKPVEDEFTRRMRQAFANARTGSRYRGSHTCSCGVRSDNADHYVQTCDGRELCTNSLAVHYLEYHRAEVPQQELLKVILLWSPDQEAWSEGVTSTFDVSVECTCPCHLEGVQMLHIVACCQGACPQCKKHFTSGLQEHMLACKLE